MSLHHEYTTRQYNWAAGQAVTIGAASAPSTALTGCNEALLSSTTNVWITVGATATKGAGSMYLSAGIPFHLRFTTGAVISGIQDSAAGTLTIIPVV